MLLFTNKVHDLFFVYVYINYDYVNKKSLLIPINS